MAIFSYFTKSKSALHAIFNPASLFATYNYAFYRFRMSFQVFMGSINRASVSAGFDSFTTTLKIVHGRFDINTITNDIALLKSPLAITFTGEINNKMLIKCK